MPRPSKSQLQAPPSGQTTAGPPPPPPAAPAPATAAATTSSGSTGAGQSRNRSKASCDNCYRRKQKCDRKWPCSHCLDRRVGHTCHFSTYNPSPARNARTRTLSKAKETTPPQPSGQQEQHQPPRPPSLQQSYSSDNGSTRADSEDGRSMSIHSSQSASSRRRKTTSIHSSEAVEPKLLDRLGYLDKNDDNLLGYLKNMRILEDDDEDESPAQANDFHPTPEVIELLRKMPSRPVTDVLVQSFFNEANWIYEMIYPVTFTERYNEWWSRSCQNLADLEFAALLLRLCSYSAQFLPSQNYTADTILGTSLHVIRIQCHTAAIALTRSSMMKGTSPSLTRIHEMFFHACYLKNEGEMKESWEVLSEAVHAAQELGLHLDLKNRDEKGPTEYELEIGKRTYWNLWLWDKFMSITLGRWPLIPDQYCTVSLPEEELGTDTLFDDEEDGPPSVFCERKLQIQLSKIGIEILQSNDGKPSTDPNVISANMEKIKSEVIDKLPPAFRIGNPEERWDAKVPHLKRKREMFRISVFACICMLLRPMMVIESHHPRPLSPADKALVAKHRLTLADAAMEMLESVGRLHMLMGGKQNRFFLLSFFTLEPATLLGMCLMSPNVNPKNGKPGSVPAKGNPPALAHADQERWQRARKSIQEAIVRLQLLSEVSSIARIGLQVLKRLMMRVDNTRSGRPGSKSELLNGLPAQQPLPKFSPGSPLSESSLYSGVSTASRKQSYDDYVPHIFNPSSSQDMLLDQVVNPDFSQDFNGGKGGFRNFSPPPNAWTDSAMNLEAHMTRNTSRSNSIPTDALSWDPTSSTTTPAEFSEQFTNMMLMNSNATPISLGFGGSGSLNWPDAGPAFPSPTQGITAPENSPLFKVHDKDQDQLSHGPPAMSLDPEFDWSWVMTDV